MTARALLLLLLCWVPWTAWATPRLTIEARIDPDLRVIRGVLHAEGLQDATWIDPLADLPVPEHELDRVRTYPGRPDEGTVRWSHDAQGHLAFVAELPRRRGDVGQAPRGLFANGAWYPQPLVDGTLPIVAWDVTVHLPPEAVGALGDTAGRVSLHWQGEAERASLAALPEGRITTLQGPGWEVTTVTRFALRAQLRNSITQLMTLAAIPGVEDGGVLVEAPLPRRLFRPGAGLAYVGDRAWRLTPVFRWLHHREGIRALLSSWYDHPDPVVRGLAGTLRVERTARRGAAQQARRTPSILRDLRPVADAVLYSREMPYQSEVFDRVFSSDSIRDDLVERFAPGIPAPVLAAQLRDQIGHAAADELAHRLARGQDLDMALSAVGVAPGWLDARRRPYHPQDYVLQVQDDVATVTRVAPADQPPEVVVVAVDHDRKRKTPPQRTVLPFAEGDGHRTVELPARHGRVRLDPGGHVAQVSTVDVQPAPLRFLLSGAISGVNFSELFLSAYGSVAIRRADDTRNLVFVRLDTNQRVNLGAAVAYTRYFGPRTRLTRRLHAITVGADGAWLSDRFAQNEGADVAMGGRLSYTLDSRSSALFPREGARFTVGLAGGGIPQDGRTYVRGQATVVGVAPLHPRVVLASRINAGLAATDIPQERLTFGGALGVRGIADREVQTNLQGVASFELRFVPVQRMGIPLAALTWIEDLQVTVGLDAGVGVEQPLDAEGVAVADAGLTRVGAVGATVGIGAIVHNFGVAPGAINLTLGLPALRFGFDAPDNRSGLPFELYLSWGVTF